MAWQRHDDCAALLLAAGDAIVAAAPDGSILLWNPGAERIFGYTEEEALGRTLDLIVPERFRARHWEGYRRVMRTGSTQYGARVLRRAGRAQGRGARLDRLHRGAAGQAVRRVKSIAAVVRDETERWQEERALRDRVAELEALARERGDTQGKNA